MGKSPINVTGVTGVHVKGVCGVITHPFSSNPVTLLQPHEQGTEIYQIRERDTITHVTGLVCYPVTTPLQNVCFSLVVNGKCSNVRGKNNFNCVLISGKTVTTCPIKDFFRFVKLMCNRVKTTPQTSPGNLTGGKYDVRL